MVHHYEYKTVSSPSYLYNVKYPYMVIPSLYWDRALVPFLVQHSRRFELYHVASTRLCTEFLGFKWQIHHSNMDFCKNCHLNHSSLYQNISTFFFESAFSSIYTTKIFKKKLRCVPFLITCWSVFYFWHCLFTWLTQLKWVLRTSLKYVIVPFDTIMYFREVLNKRFSIWFDLIFILKGVSK